MIATEITATNKMLENKRKNVMCLILSTMLDFGPDENLVNEVLMKLTKKNFINYSQLTFSFWHLA